MALAPERLQRKLAILVGLETVYGNGTPVGGTMKPVLMTGSSLTPLQGTDVARELDLSTFGHQGVILTNNYVSLTGNVEVQGSGEAGIAPAWGTLMRMAAMAEVVPAANAPVESKFVTYSPIDTGQESGVVHFNRSGVRHILLGARATWTANFATAQIPRFAFTITGLLGTISDENLPVVDLTKFIKPTPVTPTGTELRMFGEKTSAESISFDLANQIEPRFLIGDQKILHVDRMSTAQVVVEARKLAVVNWFQRALEHQTGEIRLTHGTTPGRIVQFDALNAQSGRPTEGESQRIMNYTVPQMLLPKLGNDDLVVTVK